MGWKLKLPSCLKYIFITILAVCAVAFVRSILPLGLPQETNKIVDIMRPPGVINTDNKQTQFHSVVLKSDKVTETKIAKLSAWNQKPKETWDLHFQNIFQKYNMVEIPTVDKELICDSKFKPSLSENLDVISNYTFNIDKEYLQQLSLDDNGIMKLSKPVRNPRKIPVLITAASADHYQESQGLIQTYHQQLLPHHKNLKLIYYDIGLKKNQREELKRYCKCELRKFNFKKYPSHLKNLRTKVWKPIIIQEVLKEYDLVMWADVSIRFNGHPITNVSLRAIERGIQGMTTVFSICIMTSKQMFDFLKETPCLYNYPMFRSGWIVISRNTFTLQYIMRPWVSCALDYDCMAYRGDYVALNKARRTINCHRSHTLDQAMLGIIVTRLFHERRNVVEFNGDELFDVKRDHRPQYFAEIIRKSK